VALFAALQQRIVEALVIDRVLHRHHPLAMDDQPRVQQCECDQAAVDALIAALRDRARSDDPGAIKSSIDALAHATDDFAARRMDRSIRAALAGRRIDDLASVGRAQ